MKRYILGLALIGLLLPLVATAGKLSVQGHLANGGTPTDGDHVAVFSFYDAVIGGNVLWTETDTLNVHSLLFTATLGNSVTLPDGIFSGSAAWLQVTLDGTTLAPRIAYYPQPTAAANSSGWSTDGTNVWRASGNVGVGTTSPQATLDVEGGLYATTSSTGYLAVAAPAASPYNIRLTGKFEGLFESNGAIRANGYQQVGPYGGGVSLQRDYYPGSGQYVTEDVLNVTGAGNVGIGTGNPQGRLDIATGSGNELVFSGSSPANIYGPNQDLFIDAAPGWSVLIGADGIPQQVAIRHNETTITGALVVNGNFTATGTKCRAVEGTRFGTLYFNAVESSHAVFTESGRVTLSHGHAHVALDPRWLAGVTIDRRHPLDVASVVFYGPHGEWYATPGAAGFDVFEATGADVECFWTVQASQKGYEDNYLDNPGTSRTATR